MGGKLQNTGINSSQNVLKAAILKHPTIYNSVSMLYITIKWGRALGDPGGSRDPGPSTSNMWEFFLKKNKDNQTNFKGKNSKLYPNCK